MSSVTFEEITKRYPGAARPAVDGCSFEVAEGELVVLLGPSGCGKTTLLKTVNRLVEPTSGAVRVGGVDVRTLEPTVLRRGIGYVIQQVGLFPHMTVERNVATVPRLLGWDERRARERVEELLALVGLEPDEYRGRYPSELSGGQQQRVGIARALAARPRLLLMDEPFGALDAITRAAMQEEMLRLRARLEQTVLFVTHDVDEALRLADRVAVMREGRLVQYDKPLALLRDPADAFVAELVGASDALRRLALVRVRDAMTPGEGDGPAIAPEATLREALSMLLGSGAAALRVEGAAGSVLTLEAVRDEARGVRA